MYGFRVRRRKRVIILLIGTFVTFIYTVTKWIFSSVHTDWDYTDTKVGPCNSHVQWSALDKPVVGILGPPGSGVYWLRHMIEQMTGIHTGSVYNHMPEYFQGEGHRDKVVSVMAHRMEDITGIITAGIIIYRSMQETVETQYGLEHPRDPHDSNVDNQPALHTYYGNEWRGFAMRHSQEWADTYQGFMESGVPLLILMYNELEDTNQLRGQLLRVSNFLHVPIKSSVFECVVSRSQDLELKPKALNMNNNPYSLLQHDAVDHLIRLENHIFQQITVTRDRYRPKVR